MTRFNRIVLLMLSVLAISERAYSQATVFPAKPVTIIMAVAAGGPTDVEIRLYTKAMTELTGQPFLMDYKVGAGGVIGTAYVAKAAPDGYTLLQMSGNFSVMPSVVRDLPFNTLKDFAFISLMSERAQVLVVTPSFPAKSFAEYLAYAKANPGKVSLGTTGQGGINHMMSSWLHSLGNAKVTYVPYKGEGPLVPDLISGRLDAAAIGVATAYRLAKAGKVRALGSSLSTRSKMWPDLLTISEQGLSQFVHTSWVGISAPAATPLPVINRLSENFAKAAKMPDVTAPLEPEGWVLVGSSPARLRQLVVEETERWARLAKEQGIVPE